MGVRLAPAAPVLTPAPLVAQITTQAERSGHLEAERDELRRRVELAEAERDRLPLA